MQIKHPIHEDIIPYGTPKQQEVALAFNETGTIAGAAKELGLDRRNCKVSLLRLLARAAVQGVSPDHDLTHAVVETQYLKGTSTLYDSEGNVSQQWVKTNAKAEALEEVARAIIEAMHESIPSRRQIAKPKRKLTDELMTVYPIGDAHLGLYCWDEDSEEAWDTDAGERAIRLAFDRLTEDSQPTETALIANLGDLFHTDSPANRTERSGNPLDVDGRWHKIVKVGLRSIIYAIDRCLETHESVRVINEIGNHDDKTSYMLSLALERHYRGNPRCSVDTSPRPFHRHRFGRNLIGVHHGHLMKPDALYRVMAEDWAQDWGETKYRYWYTGHIHHKTSTEIGSMVCESFRSLAARDAYHTGKGYRAGRDIQSITLHRDYGEWSRRVVNIDYLKDQK